MASITLYGGCTYCNLLITPNNSSTDFSDAVEHLTTDEPYQKLPFHDIESENDSVLCANFNNNFSGSNFVGNFNNIKYFKIMKQLSNQPKLHKVYTTKSTSENIVEDFMVGSKCPCTYYIYPVCENTNEKGQTYETLGTPIKSEPIELDDGIIRVIGLIQDENDTSIYHIDRHNVWHIEFNVSNTGFTNNLDKTFTDTEHAYAKETQGNRKYRTFPIEGLLGKYDCDNNVYIDSYDDIIEWERFINNGELKAVIDKRGVITLGDIDTNSIGYGETSLGELSVNFSFKQTDDIENVSVLGRTLPVDPFEYNILADNDSVSIQDNGFKYLAVPKGSASQ